VSVLAPSPAELAQASRMLRQAVRDRSYRGTPLGLVVGRYYRWKKSEWGATKETLRDYEAVLAKLALFYADRELTDLEPPQGTEMIREFWDATWGEATERTRAKVLSVMRDFFKWCCRERLMAGNPTEAITTPKKRGVVRETFQPTVVDQIVGAQDYPADQVACRLVLRYGLRRGELGGLRLRSFDTERRRLTVVGKGGKVRQLPIEDREIWDALTHLVAFHGLGPDSYLMYVNDTRKRRVPLEEATETLDVGRGQVLGYAWSTVRKHDLKQPPGGHRIHDWWYECLARAGVVEKGTTRGANMHRGRHTTATELLRRPDTSLKHVQLWLGHASIQTTADIYAHLDDSDLEAIERNRWED
jgi:site-specific recombinase XerC